MNGRDVKKRFDDGTPTTRVALAVCLALALACAGLSGVAAQTNERGVLQPPPAREGLVPVQLPDTTNMEAGVREHIKLSEDALASVVSDASAGAEKLAEAYGTLGQIYHAYSLTVPAAECYANAARLAPKDFRWPYLLGKIYEREGDARRAVAHLDAARALRPDYLPAHVSLGNLYTQLNRLEEAEANFRRALQISDANPAALYGLGQAALSRRSYAEAAAHFEKALRGAPEADRLHYALAMAYRGLKETEKAQAHLARSGSVGVRASDPLLDGLQDLIRGARLHLIRGRAALEARRFAEAVAEFRKAVSAEPASVPAHFNLGAALTQTGDLRGAVEQFEETLRLDPAHADAHYNLGLLFAQANQNERAIKHLRLAVEAQPRDNGARFLLAQELVKAGRTQEAEGELKRVVESDAENEDALLALVQILNDGRKYRDALAALERAHARLPHKGRTAAALAYLLAASPQTELRDGKRALELAQTVYAATGAATHGALVANALAELGRCDEAAALLRRMAAKAVEEGQPQLADKLKAELSRYDPARPCRPPADKSPSAQ